MRIPASHIVPKLEATERFDAISELLDRLIHAGTIPAAARPPIVHALWRREQTLSTGIGSRIAMPHAESEQIIEPVIAFGCSRQGVQFEAVDGVSVEFIFLFILPIGVRMDQAMRLKPKGGELKPSFRGDGFGGLHSIRDCSTAEEMAAVLNQLFGDDETDS